jgi:hypothetical protein
VNPHFSSPSLSHEAIGLCSLLRSVVPLLRQEPLLVSAVPQAAAQLRLGRHLVPKSSHEPRSFSGEPHRATFLCFDHIIVNSHIRSLNCPTVASASFTSAPSYSLISPVASPTTDSSLHHRPPPRPRTSSLTQASGLRMVQPTPPRASHQHRVLLHQLRCRPRPTVQPPSLFLLQLTRVIADSLTGEPPTFPTPQNRLPTPSSHSIRRPTPPHHWHAKKLVGRRRPGR